MTYMTNIYYQAQADAPIKKHRFRTLWEALKFIILDKINHEGFDGTVFYTDDVLAISTGLLETVCSEPNELGVDGKHYVFEQEGTTSAEFLPIELLHGAMSGLLVRIFKNTPVPIEESSFPFGAMYIADLGYALSYLSKSPGFIADESTLNTIEAGDMKIETSFINEQSSAVYEYVGFLGIIDFNSSEKFYLIPSQVHFSLKLSVNKALEYFGLLYLGTSHDTRKSDHTNGLSLERDDILEVFHAIPKSVVQTSYNKKKKSYVHNNRSWKDTSKARKQWQKFKTSYGNPLSKQQMLSQFTGSHVDWEYLTAALHPSDLLREDAPMGDIDNC